MVSSNSFGAEGADGMEPGAESALFATGKAPAAARTRLVNPWRDWARAGSTPSIPGSVIETGGRHVNCGAPLDRRAHGVGRRGQRLFLQFGLFQHPVTQPPQKLQLRAAASTLEALAPKPALVSSQDLHPPLAHAVQDQQGFPLPAPTSGLARVWFDLDQAEPT